MKTNFSLLFYLKRQKNYRGGRVPVYLRITVNVGISGKMAARFAFKLTPCFILS
ncbi:hypothetical protein FHT21_001676 [Pedobacter sp. SG908]|nr:hypothetical protein [Pedobacter sp. SG908]